MVAYAAVVRSTFSGSLEVMRASTSDTIAERSDVDGDAARCSAACSRRLKSMGTRGMKNLLNSRQPVFPVGFAQQVCDQTEQFF
ncbi:MAG: hypothetical protein CMM61_15700 [Rhodospirillaceae bacterium]|nr:hypothetical protein [Rhodospirillaceae bacterium]